MRWPEDLGALPGLLKAFGFLFFVLFLFLVFWFFFLMTNARSIRAGWAVSTGESSQEDFIGK